MNEAQKRAQQTTNSLRKGMEENLRHSVDLFYTNLVEIPRSMVAKLPEDIFVQRFLPYFSGKESIEQSPTVLVEWISIAGKPTSEVSIIDKAGNELFRVPAIFSTDSIDSVVKDNSVPFSEIYTMYGLHLNHLPGAGDRYLENTLDDKVQGMYKKPETLPMNTNRWQTIFSRYGLVSAKIQQTQIDYDELEYD